MRLRCRKFSMFVAVILLSATTTRHNVVHADTLGGIFANSENAGSLFTSIFSGLSDFVKMMGRMIDAAIEKECIYKCPNGQKPKANLYHIPRGNGCGVTGLQIPKYVPMSLLEDCCNKHDVCYATCNKVQEACDAKFKECLYNICSSLKRYISDDFLKGCKIVAKTMYTAVTTMGCKYYLDAQQEACICDESSRDEF